VQNPGTDGGSTSNEGRSRRQRICINDVMSSQAEALRSRVKSFAVRILRFVRTLPRDPAGDTAARQLARAGTSASANYHATCRARSRAEFIAKLGLVVEEADEAEHWLFVIRESGLCSGEELEWLAREGAELRAIFSTSLQTARSNHRRRLLPTP
jgi:four helix bundle protein